MGYWSLPTWGRGLKHPNEIATHLDGVVAPYMGAWIETDIDGCIGPGTLVAPYMGAWIETQITENITI